MMKIIKLLDARARNACGDGSRRVTCAWHALRAESESSRCARGTPPLSAHASTPSTSDAVLSPEIEYVRRFSPWYQTPPRTTSRPFHIVVNLKTFNLVIGIPVKDNFKYDFCCIYVLAAIKWSRSTQVAFFWNAIRVDQW
ncbi:unnamed protein product [Euphydryas editha]|uniref:Uncharacterized protein n=1 Tax=Euphydryas editha TaxID=104508 RepID=A0AAU9U861_EUPED|nr:unnamed protein product [Euphydryas editha]